MVGLHLWGTVWGSQADSCHLGGTRSFTPFPPGLFNKQDDTLSRRAPGMLFCWILCLTYSQEEPSQGWPMLWEDSQLFLFPKEVLSGKTVKSQWESSQIAGCS